MRGLRERSWLATSPLGFIALDHESGEFFLRDKRLTFPGMFAAELFGVTEGPLHEQVRRNILNVNGEDHRRLRGLVNPSLSPRAADRVRPAMRGFLERLFEPHASAGRLEAVEDLCKPYPSLTIATVMGAPLEDAPRLHRWSNLIQLQFSPDLVERRAEVEAACAEFYDYCGGLLAARREDPGEDLISTLIAAEQDGDRLSDVELVNLVLNVLVGGVDTTQSQLAHALRLFAEHPDAWAALAADPSLAPAAVEEALRYEPITPFTARITLEDVELRGVTFPKGTLVFVAAVTANRDPAAWERPEQFDITRGGAGSRVLTFGAGIHYCLGANLARAELEEALSFLAPRMPGLALDGEPAFGSVNGIYHLEQLPLRWAA
jgi:cytochrome P450